MNITAQMVKELREKTGAGMMDCKKALQECDGDMEKAIDWLREKGIMKAAKKQDRVAAEGLCNFVISGNNAYLYEINSETDFVAKNEQFLTLINEVGQALVNAQADTFEEALKATFNGKTVEELVIDATAKIGEKITFRRYTKLSKTDDQVFGAYKHMGGKIAVVVVLDGNNEEVAKDVAMHVAALNPQYLSEADVDAKTLEHEKEVLTKEVENELAAETNEKAKQAKMQRIPQIVEGKIKKWLKDICLVDQLFVKNQDLTVLQYVKNNNSNIVKFVRYEVGEGIEKRVDNFAEEVMAQVRN
ncbi:MAG: elongation factor Ts [Bacilli bacterium]|nr:elongation factor Ts [Bacilli bacterium]